MLAEGENTRFLLIRAHTLVGLSLVREH